MLHAQKVLQNIKRVLENIRNIERRANRPLNSVKLLAVSKTFSSEMVRNANMAGLTRFGENYVQEALPKIEELQNLNLEWHFIGHLQTNKVKMVIDKFDLIHSVDRQNLAEEISKRCHKRQKILIEVNLAGEASKSGCDPKELPALLVNLQKLDKIEINGLMFMPPLELNLDAQKKYYEHAAYLQYEMTKYISPGHDLSELSMGTSHDYEQAILAGATIVRLGSVIFGQRQ